MKTKSRSGSKSRHYNWGKITVLSIVVLVSAYFIWQFMFVKNSQKSEAKDFNSICCFGNNWNSIPRNASSCPTGYTCVKGGAPSQCGYGICEKKSDMKQVGKICTNDSDCKAIEYCKKILSRGRCVPR